MTKSNYLGKLAMACLATLIFIGCTSETESTDSSDDGATSTAGSGDHSGWWCVEHAIPEEECSMCSSKAADEFKAKGDWCEEHNRAESQCFICEPSRAEKYAKLYEAKFGKQPPAPTE